MWERELNFDPILRGDLPSLFISANQGETYFFASASNLLRMRANHES